MNVWLVSDKEVIEWLSQFWLELSSPQSASTLVIALVAGLMLINTEVIDMVWLFIGTVATIGIGSGIVHWWLSDSAGHALADLENSESFRRFL